MSERLARPGIHTFVQDPTCCVCRDHIKGWGRAHCDTCNRMVCRRHRTPFAGFECSDCRAAKARFQQPPVSTTAAGALFSTRSAETLIDALNIQQIDPAPERGEAIFAALFSDEDDLDCF